jgi:hypothetical protein
MGPLLVPNTVHSGWFYFNGGVGVTEGSIQHSLRRFISATANLLFFFRLGRWLVRWNVALAGSSIRSWTGQRHSKIVETSIGTYDDSRCFWSLSFLRRCRDNVSGVLATLSGEDTIAIRTRVRL